VGGQLVERAADVALKPALVGGAGLLAAKAADEALRPQYQAPSGTVAGNR
jgi:hypothetical protein